MPFFKKHKQILLYLFFGVVTTAVSLFVCFLTLRAGQYLFPAEGGGIRTSVDVAASVLQWISGVLVAFYTNHKWVFTQEKATGTRAVCTRLAVFSLSRVGTLLMEIAINLSVIYLLEALGYVTLSLPLVITSVSLSSRLWAKLASSAAVVIANYFISKLIVFRHHSKRP